MPFLPPNQQRQSTEGTSTRSTRRGLLFRTLLMLLLRFNAVLSRTLPLLSWIPWRFHFGFSTSLFCKKQMRVKYWTVKLLCYLSCSFTLSLCTDYTLYVLCPVHTRHVARERSSGSPSLGFSTLFYHTAWSPERRASPTHTTHTHTDTLLTLFLASLAKIRVELGVRGLEHTRGGEDWCQMLKDSPLKILATSLLRTNATKLFWQWRRVGC